MRGYRSGLKSEAVIAAAQQLRGEMTPTEKAMWKVLRSRQLAHLKFRRQYPFDQFVLDFYCPSLKLAIELDGSQHETADGKVHDAARTAELQGWEIKVLRFSNRAVFQDKAAVLRRIEEEIKPDSN